MIPINHHLHHTSRKANVMVSIVSGLHIFFVWDCRLCVLLRFVLLLFEEEEDIIGGGDLTHRE